MADWYERRDELEAGQIFRCHDGSHTAKDGSTINGDCEFCHRQVERPAPAK